MDNNNIEIQFFKQQLEEFKEEIKDIERRVTKIETSREKTEVQYEQIMKSLDKLNDVTIPNLMKELESIKNKPARRWETGVNALISAIVAGLVAFGFTKIGSKRKNGQKCRRNS